MVSGHNCKCIIITHQRLALSSQKPDFENEAKKSLVALVDKHKQHTRVLSVSKHSYFEIILGCYVATHLNTPLVLAS